MKNILTIALLFYSPFLFSQHDVDFSGNIDSANSSGLWIVQKSTATKIKGSFLLFDDKVKYGILTTNDDRRLKIPSLNVNVKDNQIQANINNDSVFIFDSKNIKSIQINNRLFKPYLSTENVKNDFYEVIAICSEMTLLKKYMITVKEGIVNPLTMQKQSPDTYLLKSKYYIFSNNSMKEIALKKNKIMRLFRQGEGKIKAYISKKNLSIKKELDLKLIFNYYDSLSS